MTPPMTPREKVANAIRVAVGEFRMSDGMAVIAANAAFDAIASGSGDHAELARLADDALSQKGRWDELHDLNKFHAAANPATVLALLSEIAALRGEVQNGREHLEFEADRATQAERQRDEAQEENTRWLLRMADVREASGIGVKPMLDEVPTALKAQRGRLEEAQQVIRDISDTPYTGSDWPRSRAATYLANQGAEQ